MSTNKYIISGGGTGGHIFPAIAIAQAIKRWDQDAEFLFVGALGRMEMEKVPAAGYDIIGLNIIGLQRRITLKNLSFPFKLITSLRKSKEIIKSFKPEVAIGVGGFASGPLLRMACRRGVPALIQEQNAYPGITNKLLASKVSVICVAYSGMDRFFPKEKIVITGNPVRKEVIKLEGKKTRAAEHFKLDPSRPTLLVVGGSLGARSINRGIKNALPQLESMGYNVIWQTGKPDYESIRNEIPADHQNIRVLDFISKMDYAYAIADLVTSRAGAIAISELSCVGLPAILVPFPHAAEDHQTRNAMALVNAGAAAHIPDRDAESDLGSRIIELLNDEQKRHTMSANILRFARPEADELIANEVFKLVHS